MKSYKNERHAQFLFYLQMLNEHELVLELFEQAQPCMNSDRRMFFIYCFGCEHKEYKKRSPKW